MGVRGDRLPQWKGCEGGIQWDMKCMGGHRGVQDVCCGCTVCGGTTEVFRMGAGVAERDAAWMGYRSSAEAPRGAGWVLGGSAGWKEVRDGGRLQRSSGCEEG